MDQLWNDIYSISMEWWVIIGLICIFAGLFIFISNSNESNRKSGSSGGNSGFFDDIGDSFDGGDD